MKQNWKGIYQIFTTVDHSSDMKWKRSPWRITHSAGKKRRKENFSISSQSRGNEEREIWVAWKDSIEHAMWQRNRMMIRKRIHFLILIQFSHRRCYYTSFVSSSFRNKLKIVLLIFWLEDGRIFVQELQIRRTFARGGKLKIF
jgi:hypothetical protein